MLAIVGLEGFAFGCVAQVLFDYTGRARRRWLRLFPYTRTILIAAAAVAVGLAAQVPLVARYIADGLRLDGDVTGVQHLALSGILFVITGVTLSVFTLLLHAAAIASHPARSTEVRR